MTHFTAYFPHLYEEYVPTKKLDSFLGVTSLNRLQKMMLAFIINKKGEISPEVPWNVILTTVL